MVTLFINTTQNNSIEVALQDGLKIRDKKKIFAPHLQTEKLLPLVDSVLKKNNLNFKDIKKIKVNNRGGSFTGLRIGVTIANALSYALGIPVEGRLRSKGSELRSKKFNLVRPIYSKEPNIISKNKEYRTGNMEQ